MAENYNLSHQNNFFTLHKTIIESFALEGSDILHYHLRPSICTKGTKYANLNIRRILKYYTFLPLNTEVKVKRVTNCLKLHQSFYMQTARFTELLNLILT